MADVLTGKGYAISTTDAVGLAASSSQIITVIGLSVANIHASAGSWVTVNVVRSGGVDSELAHQVEIPVNDALDILNGGKLILNNSDAIWFDAEINSHLEASISYLVQT